MDQLLKKFLSERAVELAISRLEERLYQIGEKTLPMRISPANDQVLEVRVGSTWIKLDDHISNVKHREDQAQVRADLDDSALGTGDAANPKAGAGKKKKKKKAKGGKMGMAEDIDLDMDQDDPTAQTRFAAHRSGGESKPESSLDVG